MKTYNIKFTGGAELKIACMEGIFPEDEIVNWHDTNMLLENVTECVDENQEQVDIYARWIQREQEKLNPPAPEPENAEV